MKLTGNTVLITGGTSGIGRALAEAFCERGNQVIIADRRQACLGEIAAAHPGMHGLPLDVQDAPAVDAFAAHIREQFPALNVLVNNAGIQNTEDLTADTADMVAPLEMIQTNVVSVLQLTAVLLPTLKVQPSSTLITTHVWFSLCSKFVIPNLLRQQSVFALLAPVAPDSASRDAGRGARACSASCADGTSRR